MKWARGKKGMLHTDVIASFPSRAKSTPKTVHWYDCVSDLTIIFQVLTSSNETQQAIAD